MGTAVENRPSLLDYAPSEWVPSLMLSPREREVLQLIADGLTSAEIGLEMGISIKTVETHRLNIGKIGFGLNRRTIPNDYNRQTYLTICSLIKDGIENNYLEHRLPVGFSPDPLTRRENEVAEMVLEGRSVPDISRETWYSESTLFCHLSNAYKKLQTRNVHHLNARVSLLKKYGAWPITKPFQLINSVTLQQPQQGKA